MVTFQIILSIRKSVCLFSLFIVDYLILSKENFEIVLLNRVNIWSLPYCSSLSNLQVEEDGCESYACLCLNGDDRSEFRWGSFHLTSLYICSFFANDCLVYRLHPENESILSDLCLLEDGAVIPLFIEFSYL